jgi:hypothetical protein
MKLRTFGDRLRTNCAAEIAVFIAGGLAGAVAHSMNQNGGDAYFGGFFTGVAMCSLVLSVSSAILKLKDGPVPRP